ncbi:MAG: lytic transglycosylase domain-containing protein [Candidatus Binatia bacterium]
MRSPLRVQLVTIGLLLSASVAAADILVMKAPNGQLYLTNRGEKSGYKVISRYREFAGSSGLGLRSLRLGDSARFDEPVREVASRFKLDPALVKAVMRAESAFNPMATSPKGAMGLMQLMPDTARMHGVKNAYDPVDNIHGGVRHLRYLMDRYGENLDLVLAAYNAGTKPVDQIGGIPRYPETQEYVRRVHVFHAHYRTAFERPAVVPVKTAAAPTEVLSKLDLRGRDLEQIYGKPIVLRGEERMTLPPIEKPAVFTPVPSGIQTIPAL